MTRKWSVFVVAVLFIVAASPFFILETEGATLMLQDRTMSINGVAVDDDDNIIVTGEVYDENAEKWFIRTEKYDGTDGHLIWRKEFSEYDRNIGKDVAVDESGKIVVVGSVGNSDWDILPQMDYLLIKYTNNGELLWKNTYNNGLSDIPWRLMIDQQTGNIFATGLTIKLIGGESATSNFWTVKCSGANGELLAEHPLDIEENADMGVGVAMTDDREVMVAGSTDFDKPSFDAYCIQRYATSLEPIGEPFFYRGENTNESASGLAIDSKDNLFVTGHSSSVSGQDFLTVKYDKNGMLTDKDLRDVGDAKNSAGDIAVDYADNVIITGSTASDGNHFCTVKYNNDLEEQWTRQESFEGEARAVAVDSQNNVIVVGYNTDQDDQYYTIKYNPNGTILWQGGGEAEDTIPPAIEIVNPTEGYFHFSGITLFPTPLDIVANTIGFGGFRVQPVQVRVTDNIDSAREISVYMNVDEDEQGPMSFNSDTGLHERKWIGPGLGLFTLNITAEDTSGNTAQAEMDVWYFCFIPDP